ncbi:MAG: AsmA family protein [Burkholderiales bacterium]|nr:AsmA family protein [Burkholderiales bacterium]MDE2456263.1 AsmA family protein [Burkholderiales bacterium]
MSSSIHRGLAAAALTLLALPALAVLCIAVFGWNWARSPLQALALRATGRELRIGGDLQLDLHWPAPRVHARDVSFANPSWAAAPQMLSADAVEVTVDLRRLVTGQLAFPQVRLTQARIFLEQASGGRKTWLLDRAQTDEGVRIPIGQLLLDRGEVHYVFSAQHTDVQVSLSTFESAAASPGGLSESRLAFGAQGVFRGAILHAEGTGGAIVSWRDESIPYPLRLSATLGRTHVGAAGTVTSLLHFTAVDLELNVQGDNLASLVPLVGIALPSTPAYSGSGRLLHTGSIWRYESFAGRFGQSDLAGSLQLNTEGARPLLGGALVSRRLDPADLAPSIGARVPSPAAGAMAGAVEPPRRVLPDLPFDTLRWGTLDADVTLRAQTLLRGRMPGLENLQLRLRLQNRLLTLDPLDLGLAGGMLKARVTLDGRADPLQGSVKASLRGLHPGQLLPRWVSSGAAPGHLDGDVELSGRGPSVGRMLASANGRVRLVARNGRISRLLMEKAGLHLLEILRLLLGGDRTISLRCAVADFDVANGVMRARTLALDTPVTTLIGSGRIDLARETLDLAIVPRTREVSVVALRSPIYISGSFEHPAVTLDKGRIAARGAGALALGVLNPMLALIPLVDPGPGVSSPCGGTPPEPRVATPSIRH